MKNRNLALVFLTAAAAMLTGINSSVDPLPADDNPDFIVAFTGDVQGYLEECG